MALYTNTGTQTVEPNRSVLYTAAPAGSRGVMHRAGTGQVALRGCGSQCFARYRVSFCGNLAIATGGTAGAVSLALMADGEVLPGTEMTVTPAAVGDLFNVAKQTEINIPRCCCQSIAVDNISDQAVDVQGASLSIERIA